MAGDIPSIHGLLAKHQAVLTDRLQIRTPGDLVRADRRVIHAAMRSLRPRPTLEEISLWQDAARDLAAAVADPAWEQTAAFVVSFETRAAGAQPQRRIVAEQAEHDSPVPRAVWPDWPCDTLTAWMLDRAAELNPEADAPDLGSAGALPAAAPQQSIIVLGAEIRSPAGPAVPIVPAGRAQVAIPPGARLRLSISGPADTSVALRLLRPGAPAVTPHPQTSLGASGAVEIDLSRFPTGSFTAVLAAWAPSGAWAPCIIPLPPLRRD